MKNTEWKALIFPANDIKIEKAHLITAGVLVLAGLLYFVVLAQIMEEGSVIVLGTLGTLVTAMVCSLFNLLYFLKSANPFVRFILPGLLFFMFVMAVYYEITPDLYIFLGFGLLNQLAGVYWYFSRQRSFTDSL